MKVEDFSTHVVPTNILTKDEVIEVYLHLTVRHGKRQVSDRILPLYMGIHKTISK